MNGARPGGCWGRALAALLRWTDPAQRQRVRDRYRNVVPAADLREAKERISEESLPAIAPDADAIQMRSSGSP